MLVRNIVVNIVVKATHIIHGHNTRKLVFRIKVTRDVRSRNETFRSKPERFLIMKNRGIKYLRFDAFEIPIDAPLLSSRICSSGMLSGTLASKSVDKIFETC